MLSASPRTGSLGADSLSSNVGYLLRRAYMLSADCARACVPDDTHLREVAVLALLAERAPMSQRTLGNLLHVNRSSMVKCVDSMETKRWVVRERNPDDRRSYALRMTAPGKGVLAERLRDLERGDAVLTARLSPDERDSLNRALVELLNSKELVPIASLSRHSGYLIAQTHRLMRKQAIERLVPVDLDPRDFGVLAVLAVQQPCSQNQLAGYFGVSAPAALGFVEDLEARGLVARQRSATDRRVYDVRLTLDGDRRLQAARLVVADLERVVATRLSGGAGELRRLLHKLIDSD